MAILAACPVGFRVGGGAGGVADRAGVTPLRLKRWRGGGDHAGQSLGRGLGSDARR